MCVFFVGRGSFIFLPQQSPSLTLKKSPEGLEISPKYKIGVIYLGGDCYFGVGLLGWWKFVETIGIIPPKMKPPYLNDTKLGGGQLFEKSKTKNLKSLKNMSFNVFHRLFFWKCKICLLSFFNFFCFLKNLKVKNLLWKWTKAPFFRSKWGKCHFWKKSKI